MAQKKLFALLVPGINESFIELKPHLKEQSVEVWSAQNCAEVAQLLDQTHPELIFTGTQLSDGSWRDIITLTENASAPTNVVVVGKFGNTDMHPTPMDYGAFDFILPPFETAPLAHVVSAAADNIRSRRAQLSANTAA
jgi:DNA-binding NtrC family response regulator